mgnify:FL=1
MKYYILVLLWALILPIIASESEEEVRPSWYNHEKHWMNPGVTIPSPQLHNEIREDFLLFIKKKINRK